MIYHLFRFNPSAKHAFYFCIACEKYSGISYINQKYQSFDSNIFWPLKPRTKYSTLSPIVESTECFRSARKTKLKRNYLNFDLQKVNPTETIVPIWKQDKEQTKVVSSISHIIRLNFFLPSFISKLLTSKTFDFFVNISTWIIMTSIKS